MLTYKLLDKNTNKIAEIKAEKHIREDGFYKFYLNGKMFAKFDDEIIKGIMIKQKG